MQTHSPNQPNPSPPNTIGGAAALMLTYDGRRELAKTLLGFCLTYLPHYFFLAPADFHPEMFREIQNPGNRFLEIIGFRGSAKSSAVSLGLPLWAALEKPKEYPFIVPIADTSLQSGLNIANIKTELDNNALLRNDYGTLEITGPTDKSPEGPTFESDEEWQARNMLLSNGVRILGRSRGQKIRGIRHVQHRPKLVLPDDIEDLRWVRTKENRDTTERWLRGEVLPGMDEHTGRCILIGNNLHNDGLMARMRSGGLFRVLEYPLIREGAGTEFERCTWKAKYPTQAAIDLQKKVAREVGWMREYLLKVIPEEGQPVLPEWIQYYKTLPDPKVHEPTNRVTYFDLAISKKETADYTAAVSLKKYTIGDEPKIYVMPNPLNARLDMNETLEQARIFSLANGDGNPSPVFFEDVAYQRAAIEEAQRRMLPVEGRKTTKDKRARLITAAPYIKNGTVLFPETGCEELIMQILGFGSESHDDLVDSFTGALEEIISHEFVGFFH